MTPALAVLSVKFSPKLWVTPVYAVLFTVTVYGTAMGALTARLVSVSWRDDR